MDEKNDKTASTLPQLQDLEEKEINVREYFLVIVKRRWMILTLTLFVLTVTAIYSFLQTPTYRAAVTMYINRINYNIVPEVVSDQSSWMGYEAFFQTEYKLLKSKTLARRVAERLNLSPADLLAPKEKANYVSPGALTPQQQEERRNAVANQLLGMVQVNPLKNTFLCEVSFTTTDPKMSMILANAWADEYINSSLESQYQYTQTAEDLISGQVKELQADITEKEKKLQDFSLEKNVVKLDNDRSMSSHTLEALNNALTGAVQDRIGMEVHYRDLQSVEPEALPQVASSPVVQQLKTQYAMLERDYADKSKTYKADYPEMIRIRSQMDQTKKRITEQSEEIYQGVLAAAKSDFAEAANKENQLRKQIEESKHQSIELNRKEFSYDRLKVELDSKRQLLDALMRKQSETGVSVQVKEKKATTIRIVDRAELPGGVYSPNIRRNLIFSLLMGLIVGVGFAFLLEYLDSSLKSADDVERHVQLPFLGIVPRYTVSEDSNGHNGRALVKQENTGLSPTEATDLLSHYNPSSVASEAFRTIRTSLLLSFPDGPPRTILVTSSRAGEGKTFVACNLAISLAQLDKKVVLVDADMRNPRVHRIWSLRNDQGLSRLLTSDTKPTDVLQVSKVKGLSLITSGTKTPRPAELLASKKLEHLLEQLYSMFDHVVIDSPPVMPVADSLIIASKSQSVVFVIHGGVTPRDVVQMAKQKLSRADAVMAGAVLNYIDMADPYYYYSYYSNYSYRYGQDNKPKFLQ
jgi:succinoglycan biosynthesis transport protein ExoP